MDTLVLLHTCPHPLNPAAEYPKSPLVYQIFEADPIAEDDLCKNHCAENGRGFANNALYHLHHAVSHRAAPHETCAEHLS
jgi:hypothetical protein